MVRLLPLLVGPVSMVAETVGQHSVRDRLELLILVVVAVEQVRTHSAVNRVAQAVQAHS